MTSFVALLPFLSILILIGVGIKVANKKTARKKKTSDNISPVVKRILISLDDESAWSHSKGIRRRYFIACRQPPRGFKNEHMGVLIDYYPEPYINDLRVFTEFEGHDEEIQLNLSERKAIHDKCLAIIRAEQDRNRAKRLEEEKKRDAMLKRDLLKKFGETDDIVLDHLLGKHTHE